MPFEAGVMRLDWLAELSATELEIGAVTGHATSKEVSRYTRAARQKILAERAMAKLSAGQKGNKMSHSRANLPVRREWTLREHGAAFDARPSAPTAEAERSPAGVASLVVRVTRPGFCPSPAPPARRQP